MIRAQRRVRTSARGEKMCTARTTSRLDVFIDCRPSLGEGGTCGDETASSESRRGTVQVFRRHSDSTLNHLDTSRLTLDARATRHSTLQDGR
ncbi:hypothetical protein RRG08_010064 [Elysia crispata]|uniref:Uncharacterized protein n=1 Tax=Elysia crispata TaxID=231223 RepID=A0AAE1B8N1_9GAST|nr:hypothetical protein RRG08_010064 [Elysia crispata]